MRVKISWVIAGIVAICGMWYITNMSAEISGEEYQTLSQYAANANDFVPVEYLNRVLSDGKISRFEYSVLESRYLHCMQWKCRNNFKRTVEHLEVLQKAGK